MEGQGQSGVMIQAEPSLECLDHARDAGLDLADGCRGESEPSGDVFAGVPPKDENDDKDERDV